jgi:histidine triad (HIT) family protein
MSDCIFCKIIAGEIPSDLIYQDDQIVAFRDIHPQAKVHLLIVSKDHINSLADTSEEHTTLLSHMLLSLPKLAKMQGLDNGFRTIINTGPGGGQEIDHIHFHLLGGGLPKR